MATPTVKSTYTLDLESVETLDRLAQEWGVSKSEVLRRAIRTVAAAPGAGMMDRVAVFRRLQRAAGMTAAVADRWVTKVRSERRASSSRLTATRR